jgi:hypothetical protein
VAAASLFPTVKIPVDWIVPLWQTNADQRVYPKPRVAMRMIATEDAAEATFDATALNPERMSLFTSTRPEDGADTDAWAPVHGLDYVNAARPLPTGTIAGSTDNLDTQLPDDLVEDPIYAAVTIPIDAGGRRTNLGAGRVNEGGLGTVLESLTFMRAERAKNRRRCTPKVRSKRHWLVAQNGFLWRAPATHQKTAEMVVLTA